MFSILSPTYYPCRVGGGSEEDQRAEIVSTLQKATKAFGGNLVVSAGFGGVNFITMDGNSGAVVASSTMGTVSSIGFAFREKKDDGQRVGTAIDAKPVKGTTTL